MKRKPALLWDAWNELHIQKHAISKEEAEETYRVCEFLITAKYGRTQILTRLASGRLVTIFLSYKKQKRPYVVSARDASQKERRWYYVQTQTN